MLAQLKGVGWATLASLGLHGALAWAVLSAPVGSWGEELLEPDSIEIEVTLPDPVVEPDPLPEPPRPEQVDPRQVPDEIPPAAMVERPRGQPNPPPGATSEGVVSEATLVPSTIESPEIRQEPEPREMTETERRRLAALINPANAASSSFTITGPGPSRVGPPAGLGTADGTDRPTEEQLEQQLSQGLRRQALARAYLARTEPELRRQADGSLAYSGHRFTARIRPDGSVSFEDQPNVSTNGFSSSGTMDITEAFMNAGGQDPHFAEREWFMRHTREIRERMEDEHRARTLRSAFGRLPARLDRVWGTESRSVRARRARIFHIWDEMTDDADGNRGRRMVIRWIQRTIPAGHEDAYTASEITRFNASRESTEEFAPY